MGHVVFEMLLLGANSLRANRLSNGVKLPKLLLPWLLLCMTLSACVSTPPAPDLSQHQIAQSWINSVVAYRDQLPNDHADKVLAISEEMKADVNLMFSFLPPDEATETLANWLMDEDGHNMTYDVRANFSPIEAYSNKKGNCLSFTLLLAALAKELGAELQYNAVDIPDTWGLDDKLGMVFYRHVNAVLISRNYRRIFDLAMNRYDPGYPQRFISEAQALALLHNNNAVDLLGAGRTADAVHPSKIAVSLSPDNADLWVNLGVIMKHLGQRNKTEFAFLKAYQLDRYNLAAISNLERFYLEESAPQIAKLFTKQAERARQSNPYFHYQLALAAYQEQKFQQAYKANQKAIVLHSKDPRFFELKSRIAQQQGKYVDAIKALQKAYDVSSGADQKRKYYAKAEMVSQNAVREFQQRPGYRLNDNNGERLLRDLRTRMILGN